MKSKIEIKQNQGQLLRIIPAQLELGRLLELNNEEFIDVVKATVDENPALQYNDNLGVDTPIENELSTDDKSDSGQSAFNAIINDNRSGTSDKSWILNSFAHEETLSEHVIAQLEQADLSKEIEDLARFMVGYLDSKGYMTRTKAGIVDDIIVQAGIEPDESLINEAWQVIRSLDPPGIGGVDLQDCLLIQLKRKDDSSAEVRLAIEIIETCFPAFLKNNLNEIIKKTNATERSVKDALKVISELNPKPGRQYAAKIDEMIQLHINPDFAVLPDMYEYGKLNITQLGEFPELSIDESYRFVGEEKSDNDKGESERNRDLALFLKQKCEEAENFIALVGLRNRTLNTIINAIVRIQHDFFMTGDVLQLKPMILKDVSSLTGQDLSVVSRATAGRYVLTVSGIYSLKALFNGKKQTDNDDVTTTLQIIQLIKDIISAENPDNPLTDDDIVVELKKRNIDIARRTVAKYRETAGIQSARKRKIIST